MAVQVIPWSGVVRSGFGGAATATAYAIDVALDFGNDFGSQASTVVSGQTWVTADTKLVVTPKASSAAALETALLQFSPVVHTLVAGVGFTLLVYAPAGARGVYTFNCIGVVP